MAYKVEKLAGPFMSMKGPHWDATSQSLYFADLPRQTVNCYKPETKECYSASVGDGTWPSPIRTPFIMPIDGHVNKFLISVQCNLAIVYWDGKRKNTSQPEIIEAVEPQENMNDINDAKADVLGRIWAGTSRTKILREPNPVAFEPVGSMYCVSKGKIKQQIRGILLSNGLTWNGDNTKFYFVDSHKYRIDAYDFDSKTGNISNQRTVIDFKKAGIPGMPDGITTDNEGKLHIAMFNYGLVLRIDPETGSVLSKITMPVLQTTSVAFGGKNLDELYVTTGNLDSKFFNSKKCDDGQSGCLFRVTNTGFKGVPTHNVKL